MRFNNKGEFNNPFGYNRSSYNVNIEKNLVRLHHAINGFDFRIDNFHSFDLEFMCENDFLYADPPYLISCGSYNDGRRGFEGWNIKDDLALFDRLDHLDRNNIRFALSNVMSHKGNENAALREWANKYNIHYLKANYSNSNYQAKACNTLEVLITNY